MLVKQNLWSLLTWSLFSLEMYPVWEPTSNRMMLTVWPPITEIRCWYFWYFELCDIFMRVSAGTVSSKMFASFLFFSISIYYIWPEWWNYQMGSQGPPSRCLTIFYIYIARELNPIEAIRNILEDSIMSPFSFLPHPHFSLALFPQFKICFCWQGINCIILLCPWDCQVASIFTICDNSKIFPCFTSSDTCLNRFCVSSELTIAIKFKYYLIKSSVLHITNSVLVTKR